MNDQNERNSMAKDDEASSREDSNLDILNFLENARRSYELKKFQQGWNMPKAQISVKKS